MRGTCFSTSRTGWTVNTYLVKVGCRGFVRKYMQPLLSQGEREKTDEEDEESWLTRRTEAASERGSEET